MVVYGVVYGVSMKKVTQMTVTKGGIRGVIKEHPAHPRQIRKKMVVHER